MPRYPAVLLALLLLADGSRLYADEPAALDFFEKEVRPLLVERCQGCHGDSKPKGGLKLTSRASLLDGGASGPVVVAGKPDESPLIQVVRYKAATRMPPKEKLADREIAILVRWVQLGAPWPETKGKTEGNFVITAEQRRFWSLQPVKDLPSPAVKDATWPRSPIDRHVLAKLEARGLKPVGAADRRTLIRRATFDLTGLPPAPEEIDAALADQSEQWFARVVDRLLASRHYGERWGRHWLDLAHYADTAGETADFPIPDAYRYRNYVIDSFNADKPYDQFIREQVAGDLLAVDGPRDQYAERLIATGFLASARRFGFDPENYQHLTIEDTIDTLGKSVLGLTIACARCHDHKFDPISMADYYALYGILDSTRYPYPGSESRNRPSDLVMLLPPGEAEAFVQAVVKPFEEELKRCDSEMKKLLDEKAVLERAMKAGGDEKKIADVKARLTAMDAAQAEAKKRRDTIVAKAPQVERAYAVSAGKPRHARIHKRGDPRDPGAEVPRRFVEVLGGQEVAAGAAGGGRLQLAEWLTSPQNPLTARVMVNRIWQHHFGHGLVRTASNFGKQGRPPTHPELLDYLADYFMANGGRESPAWSIKKMHRLIMLSRTYQLSSGTDAQNAAADPDNEWLWHFERRRLDAESIRDALLAVSGGLDRTMGGPHPFPPESRWGFTQHNPFQADYPTSRRSVYLMTQRTRRHAYLALFDAADPNSSTAQRTTTTVPTQALFFLNNPFVHEQAARFADRLLAAETEMPRRLERAFQLAFGRPSRDEERRTATEYLQDSIKTLAAAGVAADRQASQAWASYLRVLLSSNEFIYVD